SRSRSSRPRVYRRPGPLRSSPECGRVADYRGAMISEHRPDVGPERSGPSGLGEAGAAPRLDAQGMPVERAARDGDAPTRERGPSLLLPALVSAAGVLLAGFEVFSLVTMDLPEGEPLPLHRAVLAGALAMGGFSVTRLLQ